MDNSMNSKIKVDSSGSEDEFERLCKIVHYQKALFVLLIIQTIINFAVDLAENDFILISSGVAFIVVTVIYIIKIVKFSRMFNKIPLTILLGFLAVIFILNFIPLIVLFVQGNREISKYGIKTGYSFVKINDIRNKFEKI